MGFLSHDTILPGTKARFDFLDGVIINFSVVSNARRMSAKWKGAELMVVVPPCTRLREVEEPLSRMAPRILAKRPRLRYDEGQVLAFDGFTVTIGRQSLKPYTVTLTGATLSPRISAGSALDFADIGVTEIVSRMMCVVARKVAPLILLPRARELASELELNVNGWKISRGRRTLGTCHADRTISLSEVVVFLPPELRDYIIFHELAHLQEMNHSPRFHAVCDSYCRGREKELVKKLKNYSWPIL